MCVWLPHAAGFYDMVWLQALCVVFPQLAAHVCALPVPSLQVLPLILPPPPPQGAASLVLQAGGALFGLGLGLDHFSLLPAADK